MPIRFKITISIIILLLAIAASIYFYDSYKKTQANVLKVEESLSDEGFSDFYQKQSNIFCAQAEDGAEQENIVRDMLWTLGLDEVEVRKLERVECPDGSQGFLVK